MIRALMRLLLTLALLASAFLTAKSVLEIAENPALRPLREATAAEIAATASGGGPHDQVAQRSSSRGGHREG